MMDAKRPSRPATATWTPRSSRCASRASPRPPSAPSATPARARWPWCATARSPRSSSCAARPTSSPSPRSSSRLVDEIAARVAAEGEGAVDALHERVETLLTTLKENISIGRVVRLESPATARSSTPTCTSRPDAASTPSRSSPRAAARRSAHDVAVHIAFAKPRVPVARRRARGRGRRRARDDRGDLRATRASPRRRCPRSSRAGSTAGSRTACCSSSPTRATRSRSIAQFLGAGTIVAFAQVVIGRLGRVRRVVLKLSGEALASAASDETIDASTVDFLAHEIAKAMDARRPRARRGRRRRQHLARRDRRDGRDEPRQLRPDGHARHGDQRPGPPGRHREPRPADARACRPSGWTRSPSPTSAGARCATWRRAGSSSSRPAWATRTSRPTPPRPCAPPRSRPRSCSRAPTAGSTASTPRTRGSTRPAPCATRRSPSTR